MPLSELLAIPALSSIAISSKVTIDTLEQNEMCSKLTIKIAERCQWRRSGVFVVNFEHISHLVLAFYR